MKPRSALVIALVAAGAALALVSVDLYYSLTATLDTREADGWKTLSSSEPVEYGRHAYPGYGQCGGRDLRLVVDNDVPFSQDVHIHVSYYNASSSRNVVLLDESWSLDAGEVRTYEFTIPLEALEPPADENRSDAKPGFHAVDVAARVGDQIWLSTCVQTEEVDA